MEFDPVCAVLLVQVGNNIPNAFGRFRQPAPSAQLDHCTEVAGEGAAKTRVMVQDSPAEVIRVRIALHIQVIIRQPGHVI